MFIIKIYLFICMFVFLFHTLGILLFKRTITENGWDTIMVINGGLISIIIFIAKSFIGSFIPIFNFYMVLYVVIMIMHDKEYIESVLDGLDD